MYKTCNTGQPSEVLATEAKNQVICKLKNNSNRLKTKLREMISFVCTRIGGFHVHVTQGLLQASAWKGNPVEIKINARWGFKIGTMYPQEWATLLAGITAVVSSIWSSSRQAAGLRQRQWQPETKQMGTILCLLDLPAEAHHDYQDMWYETEEHNH